MFGISSLGWAHTLGSLPALPAAAYMFVRHGRIVPRTVAGRIYFVSMLIGAITVALIAHQSVSYFIAGTTVALLLFGYGIGRRSNPGRAARYIETICLTLTAFLLMVPTVSETLRRVPDGHPLAADLNAPILLGAQGILVVLLVVGLTLQLMHLRKQRAV